MTMREKFVAIAQAEIGVSEPYGDDKYIKWYNATYKTAISHSAAWCCIFVSWCAYNAGVPVQIIKHSASCTQMTNWFKSLGKYKARGVYIPRKGDIIMYDWDKSGDSDHVGIVESCSNTTVTVIEGNYSNSVKRRNIALTNTLIRGYCVPEYTDDTQSAPVTASRAVLKFGSKGADVRYLQDRLNIVKSPLGLPYALLTVDGDFGAKTQYAVTELQKSQGLKTDGIVGAKTWDAVEKNYPRQTLKLGMKGANVELLQARLNYIRTPLKLKYALLATDGIFGTKTQYAVTELQKARKLPTNGIVDAHVWAALETNYGDIDDDGKVTAVDANLALQASVGKTALTGKQQKAADMNADGKVTAADASEILKRSVGK